MSVAALMAGHASTGPRAGSGRFHDHHALQFVYPALTADTRASATLGIIPRIGRSPASVVTRICPLSRRLRLLAVLAVAVFGLLLATSGPALAASCGRQVVDDWYDNGRVDKIYPLSCYREAIRILPTDVIDYGTAKQEIGRALAYAKQGKQDPGSKPTTGTTGTGPTETSSTEPVSTETAPAQTTPETTPTTQTTTDPGPGETDTSSVTEAGGSVDTAGPSSVPVPLIVLGGLAILLLAAGSAGYLARRSSGRKGGDGTPPASA